MIVVLGAGLAGLSTALHLGDREYLVLEQESEVGGLARSVDAGGFLFDFTGHLLHLKNEYVRSLVDELLGDNQVHLERSAWIRYGDAWVPYPFQVNTHVLPIDDRVDCVMRFIDTLPAAMREHPGRLLDPAPEDRLPLSFLCVKRPAGRFAQSFRDWVVSTFGQGFADRFFIPFNEKNFATDLATLSADWVSWAIPKPDLDDVLRGAIGIARKTFGYNPTFQYPRSGGIRELPMAIARRVKPVDIGRRVRRVIAGSHTVELADGTTLEYDALVATNPLPELVAMTEGLDDRVRAAAGRLRHCSVASYNFGLEGELPHRRHWTYFPERCYPFYRVGFPGNLTPGMVPAGASSICAEVAYSSDRFPPPAEDSARVLAGLVQAGLIDDTARVRVQSRLDLPYAYVLFDEARREALPVVFRALLEQDIVPVGRYGSWDYLSMETTILQGRETARFLRGQSPGSQP